MVLSNGVITILDQELRRIHKLDIPTGAKNFSIRKCFYKQKEIRLCVSIGKILHICDLSAKKSTKRIITLPNEPKNLIWVEDEIYLAFEKEYYSLHYITGKLTDILSLRDPVNPNFYHLPTQEIIMSSLSKKKEYKKKFI